MKNASQNVCFIMIVSILAIAFRSVLRENTIGADFYIYWRAGRAVFQEGLSPYDREVTEAIQMAIYRRLALPQEDQVAFAYPGYALLIVLPFTWLSFRDAQAIWLSFFLAGWLAAGIWLSNRRPWLGVTVIFFYPLAFGLLMGNFNILVGLALAVFFGALIKITQPSLFLQVISGLALSLSLVKPQFAWLLLAFALLKLIRLRRWPTLISFAGSFSLVLAASLLLMPGWISGWLMQTRAYNVYIPPQPLIESLPALILPESISLWVSYGLGASLFITILALLWNWSKTPTAPILTRQEILITSVLALSSYLVHPWPKSYEQIVVLLPLLFWAALFAEARPLHAAAFWVIGIVISWWALYDNLKQISEQGIYSWPVLFFAVWLLLVWKINLPERQFSNGST